MVEVAIAMPIALIAIGMLVQMFAGGSGLREAGRESGVAITAAQSAIEKIRNEDFRQVFALYNEDPYDDPGGPGTAPGHRFDVADLVEIDSDPDGVVGEIILPTWNAGSAVAAHWQVRENAVNVPLGMPRDLNGDAVVDDEDHSADYTLMPVVVVLRWRGRFGPRELRLFTVLAELYG